jgi:hypothetical protein
MLVRSTPSDAVVRLDGVERGRTPVALRNLDYGQYRVAVTLPGHAAVERQVAITREVPAAAMTFELVPDSSASPSPEREPPVADAPAPVAAETRPRAGERVTAVEIVSKPLGARVFFDGQPAGVTPLRISGVSPGPHTIRLEQAGYRPWTETVHAAPDRLTRIAASLEPASDR